jgi:hypothetical protein
VRQSAGKGQMRSRVHSWEGAPMRAKHALAARGEQRRGRADRNASDEDPDSDDLQFVLSGSDARPGWTDPLRCVATTMFAVNTSWPTP